eukprot:m.183814 g.183814  ORF g.183814 m.183814 type:complete len:84 (+) comp39313_c0_seq56:525-776(+)
MPTNVQTRDLAKVQSSVETSWKFFSLSSENEHLLQLHLTRPLSGERQSCLLASVIPLRNPFFWGSKASCHGLIIYGSITPIKE